MQLSGPGQNLPPRPPRPPPGAGDQWAPQICALSLAGSRRAASLSNPAIHPLTSAHNRCRPQRPEAQMLRPPHYIAEIVSPEQPRRHKGAKAKPWRRERRVTCSPPNSISLGTPAPWPVTLPQSAQIITPNTSPVTSEHTGRRRPSCTFCLSDGGKWCCLVIVAR